MAPLAFCLVVRSSFTCWLHAFGLVTKRAQFLAEDSTLGPVVVTDNAINHMTCRLTESPYRRSVLFPLRFDTVSGDCRDQSVITHRRLVVKEWLKMICSSRISCALLRVHEHSTRAHQLSISERSSGSNGNLPRRV